MNPSELLDLLSALRGEPAGPPDGVAIVVVDADEAPLPPGWSPGVVPVVVVGIAGERSGDDTTDIDIDIGTSAYDVVLAPGDPLLDSIVDNVDRTPLAAVALAVLLRQSAGCTSDAGLAAESAVYSMLQGGPEFDRWRNERARRPLVVDAEAPVLLHRDGDMLRITLNRPARHNAVNAALRQELAAALAVATADDSIEAVVLDGAGRSFCSGGDLDDFGTFPDPATAHVTRLATSPAHLADQLAERLTVHLQGACMGAGIEVASFARRVVASPDVRIALPELGLGLVPGAGGTVSLPRRIGRQRTALLALSGTTIDAPTALAWGLVDAVS